MNPFIKIIGLGSGVLLLWLLNRQVQRRQANGNKKTVNRDPAAKTEKFDLLTLESVILWFKQHLEEAPADTKAVLLNYTLNPALNSDADQSLKALGYQLFIQGYYYPNRKEFVLQRVIAAQAIDELLAEQMGTEELLIFE